VSRKFDLSHIISIIVIAIAAVTLVTIWSSELGDREVVSRPAPFAPATAAESPAMVAFKQGSQRTIDAYLREHPVRKLQIGAGSARHEGWLNTDIEAGEGLAFLDASKPFPFADNTFHYIASEHVIEHLSYEDGKVMLAESFRVLAPGGKVRIATPNLLRYIELFQKQPSEAARNFAAGKLAWHEWPRDPSTAAIILNLQLSSWGHRFIYDPVTLEGAMARAGLTAITQFPMSESDDPVLKGFEARTTGVNSAVNEYETMVLQAVKPARVGTTQ
jgi:predicted SAM-dependent methyltransferase